MSKISRPEPMDDNDLHNLERLLIDYLDSNVSPGYKDSAKRLLQSLRMMKSQRERRRED